MKRLLPFLLLIFIVASSVAQSSKKISKKEKEFILLYIDKKGKIIENNQQISFKELERKLFILKQKKGVVHLFQTNISKKSIVKIKNKVIKLISSYKIPIRPFADKNFQKEITW